MACNEVHIAIEKLEHSYLLELDNLIASHIQYVSSLFSKRFKLYDYWKDLLSTESKRLTDLGIGAERVFWKIISSSFPTWNPVPLFIGSNLFFETDDAFVHIDIKSVYVDNVRDYGGLVEVGDAQTSYPMKKKYGAKEEFKPKIQPFYDVNGRKKYSLTYFIQIIYEKPERIINENLDAGPLALVLVSMPNGMLYDIYGDDIVKYPKSYITKNNERIRPANYRYYYSEKPCFICLEQSLNINCTYRFRIYFNKKYNNHKVRTDSDNVIISPKVIIALNHKRCKDQDCYIRYF